MSAAPNFLEALLRFVAYTPFSVVPVLTWSVFTAVMLSLYFYYEPKALDYIFTPMAMAYVMYAAYKRDRWGGLAGAALGVVMIPMFNWSGILADASQLFWMMLVYLVDALKTFIMAWAPLVFIAGFFAGLMPFVSIIFGVVAGLVLGFAISGTSMYITFISSSARKIIHKTTQMLPPGAMALTALPTAALVMAVEVALVIVIIAFAVIFALGFLLGSVAGSILFPIKLAGDGISFLVGLVISKFFHSIQLEAFSPAAWVATVLAYVAGAGTPAMVMALSVPTLLSNIYGYRAYTWMAVALSVHAYLVSIGAA
jgi:hypothetical protein